MLPLTSQERKVILFILCFLICGLGIDCFKKRVQRGNLIDYEALKSRFFDKADINKANFSQLSSVPGMGENLANAIIAYRKKHGAFASLDDLKNIKGIKHKKLEQFKNYLVVNKETP